MERTCFSTQLHDAAYPLLLKEIPKPPKQLFCVGTLPPPDTLAVSIVGTRKATTHGRSLAHKIAYDLASQGIVIVSGLALGIDTAAHEGAVEARGRTIAVLSDGVETIYPSRNTELAKRIISLEGALVSEYKTRTPYYPGQFIQRNRIISGICTATIVIEAPECSGTLATARFALEQGREVFVVPGPIDHPNYIGSHHLIREGARLVTSAADIYEDLNIAQPRPTQSTLWTPRTPHEQTIIAILTQAGIPLSVDKISELTTMEARTINTAIASLVMEGMVKETERGYSI